VSTQTITSQQQRAYQDVAIESLRACLRRQVRRIVLVAPTGSGKTTIASRMIHAAAEKGKRTIFLAHRRELITQCSDRLAAQGVQHGIIMGAHPHRRPWLPVHVASVPTLANRTDVEAPDLVFVDECHRARAKSYEAILARWPGAAVIGLTATPVRTDGRGLGDLFGEMVQCPDIQELTGMGYLVPTRVFAPANVDLGKVRVGAEDYNQAQLAGVMDRATLTGDIVAHWLRLAKDRLTVAFGVNCDHSRHIRDQFKAANIKAEHLDGKTPGRQRDQLLADLTGGAIRVLCSVGVLCEGWDAPSVSCAILSRPTVSLALYLQMVGRILRPWKGKRDGLILDHAGCVAMHGLPDDPRVWTLEVDGPLMASRRKSSAAKVCPKCYRAYGGSAVSCKPCAWVFSVAEPREGPEQLDGELAEVDERRKLERYLTIPDAQREQIYRHWLQQEGERAQPGYAEQRYRGMFHDVPRQEWLVGVGGAR